MDARQYALIVAVLVAVLTSLGVGLGLFRKAGVPAAEFVANEAKWRAAGIRSYSVTIQQLCECDVQPVRVTVRDGVVESARSIDASEPPREVERQGRPLSIDQVFARISEGYTSSYDHIAATYDTTIGYPIDVIRDPWKEAVDDEVHYVLSDFESQDGG